MSTETREAPHATDAPRAQEQAQESVPTATKPVAEHEWLRKLLGEWRVETEMQMGPGQPAQSSVGFETVRGLGELWAMGEGQTAMPDGTVMDVRFALGYDVSFKEYRGSWFASVSSHLWKQTGTLSADGSVMTLDCVGPNMVRDGETANYRDVITIVDSDHRTLTSLFQDDNGQWIECMSARYTRVA